LHELEPEEVREHALTVAKDLIENVRSSTIRDWFECSFESTDEAGESVIVVPFSEALKMPSQVSRALDRHRGVAAASERSGTHDQPRPGHARARKMRTRINGSSASASPGTFFRSK
jgi:hypothetical protein